MNQDCGKLLSNKRGWFVRKALDVTLVQLLAHPYVGRALAHGGGLGRTPYVRQERTVEIVTTLLTHTPTSSAYIKAAAQLSGAHAHITMREEDVLDVLALLVVTPGTWLAQIGYPFSKGERTLWWAAWRNVGEIFKVELPSEEACHERVGRMSLSPQESSAELTGALREFYLIGLPSRWQKLARPFVYAALGKVICRQVGVANTTRLQEELTRVLLRYVAWPTARLLHNRKQIITSSITT